MASLHQAIADVLPTRLEFYESWLNTAGLRHGSVGLPALAAVLSFLRREGIDDIWQGSTAAPPDAEVVTRYQEVVTRAGEYAAAWTAPTLPQLPRVAMRLLPHGMRIRLALGMVRAMVKATYQGSRAVVKVRRSVARVDIRGSLFCGGLRERQSEPRCGFYVAAIARLLRHLGVSAETSLTACRALGGPGCFIDVRFHRRGTFVPPPATATPLTLREPNESGPIP